MEKKFKPFDKVLVREGKKWPWRATFYSHYNPITYHHYTTSGAPINDILPYEGNEHLVGTTDEPDEEVKLEEGEWCIFFDNFELVKEGKHGVFRRFQKINRDQIMDYNHLNWNYAIRFSDFNSKNIEETQNHILCAKKGRIVKYKD